MQEGEGRFYNSFKNMFSSRRGSKHGYGLLPVLYPAKPMYLSSFLSLSPYLHINGDESGFEFIDPPQYCKQFA